jgi:hypothetical protein
VVCTPIFSVQITPDSVPAERIIEDKLSKLEWWVKLQEKVLQEGISMHNLSEPSEANFLQRCQELS